MSEVTCRGSYMLGTACGRCSRCKAEVIRMQESNTHIPKMVNVGTKGHIDYGDNAKREVAKWLNEETESIPRVAIASLLTKLEEKEREVGQLEKRLPPKDLIWVTREEAGKLQDFDELKAENKRLMGVVEKYAGCTEECANRQTSDGKALCDCGITEALASLQKEKEE